MGVAGWLSFLLYQALSTAVFLLGLPYVIWRGWRHPREMRERLGFGDSAGAGGWWVHGASLGEMQAVTAFLEDARLAPRDTIVTVLSVSARARIGDLIRDRPYRTLRSTCGRPGSRSCGDTDPVGLILVETEIWPGWLGALALSGVPVAVVSARISTGIGGGFVLGGRSSGPTARPLLRWGADALDATRWRSSAHRPWR
ncbi:MAG: glycosyltransferase N-terminal domain-containing protein [Candidatus Eisenbacteria bacterium]